MKAACSRIVAAACLAALVVALGSPAGAIDRVTVTPSVVLTTYGSDAPVSMNWTIDKTGRLGILSSAGRIYSAHEVLLATMSTRLESATVGTSNVAIPETVTIPRSVMDASRAEGHNYVRYVRTFDEPGEVSGSAGVRIEFSEPCGMTEARAIPETASIALGQAPMLSIRWVAEFAPAAVPGSIGSSHGVFKTSAGEFLGEWGGSITLSLAGGRAEGTELLDVPRDIAYRAWKGGATRVDYIRTFGEGGCERVAQVSLGITGGGAAEFGLQRLALRFSDGTLAKIIPEGAALQAYADVTVAGAGFLEGAWEISTPVPGTPIFRTLALVSEHLLGSSRTTLASPPLPTGSQGLHLIRLRVTNPAGLTDSPTIRYYVGLPPSVAEVPRAPVVMEAAGPAGDAVPGALFSWTAVAGTRVYQLEIYQDEGTSQFVAGMLIPGDRLDTPLSQVAAGHLKPGRTYRWRVVALGPGGEILGQSEQKGIRTP